MQQECHYHIENIPPSDHVTRIPSVRSSIERLFIVFKTNIYSILPSSNEIALRVTAIMCGVRLCFVIRNEMYACSANTIFIA